MLRKLLVGAFASLEYARRTMGVVVLGCILMLLLPFAPGIGITKNGAARWFG